MSHRVRITTQLSEDVNGNKIVTFVAETQENGKSVKARGATEGDAVKNLKAACKERADIRKAREGYPKYIEAEW